MMSELRETNETSETRKTAVYATPTWVKAFGIAAIVLFLLIAILMLTGDHSPARHFPSAESTATEQSE